MNTLNSKKRMVFVLVMVLTGIGFCRAQEAKDFAHEQQIYEWFVAGNGESLHATLSPQVQAQLPVNVLNGLYRQLEQQFGKLQAEGTWKEGSVQGVTVYYRDMQFEKLKLRFTLAFDAEGKVNGMTVTPSPEPGPIGEVGQAVPDKDEYEERDITVLTDSFHLPGTLTLPKQTVAVQGKKVPCVILVHGSGPNDRDETIGPNKPFRDLAMGLAEQGIATIRYDKRTLVYGASFVPVGREIDYDVETVDDALSAVALARTLPEVATDSIFVLGHSLGGMLAPRIAERAGLLAGIILLAVPARKMANLLVEQIGYLASLPGVTAEAKLQAEVQLKQAVNMQKLGTAEFDESIPLPMGLPRSYGLFDIRYNPVEVAAKLTLPILVLQGERDYQVTMEDFGLWRSGLSGCANAAFKSYPSLNHLLQEGHGKATPMEYGMASSIPSYVIEDIAAFVQGRMTH